MLENQSTLITIKNPNSEGFFVSDRLTWWLSWSGFGIDQASNPPKSSKTSFYESTTTPSSIAISSSPSPKKEEEEEGRGSETHNLIIELNPNNAAGRLPTNPLFPKSIDTTRFSGSHLIPKYPQQSPIDWSELSLTLDQPCWLYQFGPLSWS